MRCNALEEQIRNFVQRVLYGSAHNQASFQTKDVDTVRQQLRAGHRLDVIDQRERRGACLGGSCVWNLGVGGARDIGISSIQIDRPCFSVRQWRVVRHAGSRSGQ